MPRSRREKQNRAHLAPLKKGPDGTKVTFPFKLWDVLETTNSRDNFIRWNETGTCLIVDEERYEQEVMLKCPGFMQISSFANFRRQMRWYSFDWQEEIRGIFEFTHPYFQRGREDLLPRILTRRIALNQRCPTPEREMRGRGRPRKRVVDSYYEQLKYSAPSRAVKRTRRCTSPYSLQVKRTRSALNISELDLSGSADDEKSAVMMYPENDDFIANECIYSAYPPPAGAYGFYPMTGEDTQGSKVGAGMPYEQYMPNFHHMGFAFQQPDILPAEYYNSNNYTYHSFPPYEIPYEHYLQGPHPQDWYKAAENSSHHPGNFPVINRFQSFHDMKGKTPSGYEETQAYANLHDYEAVPEDEEQQYTTTAQVQKQQDYTATQGTEGMQYTVRRGERLQYMDTHGDEGLQYTARQGPERLQYMATHADQGLRYTATQGSEGLQYMTTPDSEELRGFTSQPADGESQGYTANKLQTYTLPMEELKELEGYTTIQEADEQLVYHKLQGPEGSPSQDLLETQGLRAYHVIDEGGESDDSLTTKWLQPL